MLLDTSGLLKYLYTAEAGHEEAAALLERPTHMLTHNLVLAELVALAEARRYARSRVLTFLGTIVEHPYIEVVWVGRELHDKAVELLTARRDKSYSLCDAVSFVLMRDRGLTEALTTDRHFEQEGFRRLLSPP